MKKENYRPLEHSEFIKYIDKLCTNLDKYLKENNIKVDYICPVLRSGGIPAIYISNKLNIMKFAPFQVKHIAYKNGENTIELIYNPLTNLKIEKPNPCFLVVEAMHSTGTSVKLCIDEIKKCYPTAKILYICVTKAYGYPSFENYVDYEDVGFYYNRDNQEYTEEECQKMHIEYYNPLFPWENLEIELNHPDDLEENIFF